VNSNDIIGTSKTSEFTFSAADVILNQNDRLNLRISSNRMQLLACVGCRQSHPRRETLGDYARRRWMCTVGSVSAAVSNWPRYSPCYVSVTNSLAPCNTKRAESVKMIVVAAHWVFEAIVRVADQLENLSRQKLGRQDDSSAW